MNRRLRLACLGAAVTLIITLGGCSDATAADPGFAGHWTSTEWGEHYIVVEGSTMKITYTHDDGRVVGTLAGAKFTGWWTESPSRQRSEEHTSELQSPECISYAVFCLDRKSVV